MSNICRLSQTKETIFSGRNNSFTLEYTLEEGTPDEELYDFTDTTKVEFILNGKAVNSVAQPTWFDFSTAVDGRIIFKLGAAGYVAADNGEATVIVYDAANPTGAVFANKLGPTQLIVNVVEV